MSERVTRRERTRPRLGGNTTSSQTNLDHSLDFGPKFGIIPVAPLKYAFISLFTGLFYAVVMASPQPRHGQLRSHRYKTQARTLTKIALGFMHPLFRFLRTEGIFGLLSQAVQCAATLSGDEALQLIKGITGRRRLRFRRVSPLIHHLYTSCTRQSTSIHGGCSAPPKRRRARPKRGAY